MPFFKNLAISFALAFTSLSTLFINLSHALTEGEPIHFTGDKEVWNRKENQVDLKGHAIVVQMGETLTADFIHVDFNSRMLIAKGNCVYNASDSVVWGDEMRFNIDTRVGEVIGGRVSNNKFSLRGEVINKLGGGHYKTKWGEYTTCIDCAPSWSLLAEEIDMQTEDYAYFKNVTPRLKDAPIFWFPYLFMPMKTRRQSGVLFPQWTFGTNNGTTFILPYFWAIDRSADMTFGAGVYTNRGIRLQWEGRYKLNDGEATSRFFYIRDSDFYKSFNIDQDRWGFSLDQNHRLPWGIKETLSVAEVSDTYYPFYFSDVRGGGDVFLPSTLTLQKTEEKYSAGISFERYRNLLNTTNILSAPGTLNPSLADSSSRINGFDPRAVQALPRVGFFLPDRYFLTPSLVGGVDFNFVNFTRSARYFDYDQKSVPFGVAIPNSAPPFTPGQDPIREAMRLSISPTLYTTFRPWDVVTVVPSLQYKSNIYNFGNGSGVSPLVRGYMVFQTDISTQLEKIYDFGYDTGDTYGTNGTNGTRSTRAKHYLRPFLTYSFIPFPYSEGNSHPFQRQITQYNGQQNPVQGYYFDDNDITPLNRSQNSIQYFTPLGNSLAYGFSSQWIRRIEPKRPKDEVTYQTSVDFKAGQSVNFMELMNPIDPLVSLPFTRFFSQLSLSFDKWSSDTTYYYYSDQIVDVNPNIPALGQNPQTVNKNVLSSSLSYTFVRLARERLLAFERSLNLSYGYSGRLPYSNNLTAGFTWALTDWIVPSASATYRFALPNSKYQAGGDPLFLGFSANVAFQSPSQCWRVVVSASYTTGPTGFVWYPDFSLNLTGTGFGGLLDFVGQAAQLTGG